MKDGVDARRGRKHKLRFCGPLWIVSESELQEDPITFLKVSWQNSRGLGLRLGLPEVTTVLSWTGMIFGLFANKKLGGLQDFAAYSELEFSSQDESEDFLIDKLDDGLLYRVQVGVQSLEGITKVHVVLRRFNDFLKLFADIKKEFPRKNTPPAPLKGLLRLKSRSLLEEVINVLAHYNEANEIKPRAEKGTCKLTSWSDSAFKSADVWLSCNPKGFDIIAFGYFVVSVRCDVIAVIYFVISM
ncbi:hypothetical protein JHK85_050777 [Glycine max]|nr:hypothetical protein JHK85_050777 [Glycine max]